LETPLEENFEFFRGTLSTMAGNQSPQPVLLNNCLTLGFCPHCGRSNPSMVMPNQANWITTIACDGAQRMWEIYMCTTCGKLVVAFAISGPGSQVSEIYPIRKYVAAEIPEKLKEFLSQAIRSVHTPAGAVMLCASAVEAMLKEKGYEEGTLNQRIDKAVEDHLLTKEMGTWATPRRFGC